MVKHANQIKLRKKIEEIAKRVQLQLNENEINIYLNKFICLEKKIVDFIEIKIPKGTTEMERINRGHLDLKEIRKISKKYSSKKVKTQKNGEYFFC